MLIGHGGYAQMLWPPREYIPKRFRKEKYVERYTRQTKEEIEKGQAARKIFDPGNKMTREIIAMYHHPDFFTSQIYEFFSQSLYHLLRKTRGRTDLPLFWKTIGFVSDVATGLVRLHKEGYIHHDIKTNNILCDESPDLKRLLLIDWATALPFSDVYDARYKVWHEGDNDNLPPEYKAFAHYQYGFPVADFVDTFSRNPVYEIIVKIDPRYPRKLRRAFRSLQKRMGDAGDAPRLMTSVADKADVFGLGVVVAELYENWNANHDPLKREIVALIRHMIDPDPFSRWDMTKTSVQLKRLLQKHNKKISSAITTSPARLDSAERS